MHGQATQGPPTAPSLSVVLPVLGPPETVGAALALLVPRCSVLHAELIVVSAAQTGLPRHLPHAFPGVRFLKAPPESSSPTGLRAFGVRHASGDLIAIRPDNDLGDLGWLAPFAATVPTDRDEPAIVGSPLAGSTHIEVEVPLDGMVH